MVKLIKIHHKIEAIEADEQKLSIETSLKLMGVLFIVHSIFLFHLNIVSVGCYL